MNETAWYEVGFIVTSIVAFILLLWALFNIDKWIAASEKKYISAKVEYYQNQIERQKGGNNGEKRQH